MKKITYESLESLTDSILERLRLQPIGIKGDTYFLNIQGHAYGYKADPKAGLSIKEIVKKFEKAMKFSPGKALANLKKRTKLISGSRKQEYSFEYSDMYETVSDLIRQVREGAEASLVIEEAARRYKNLTDKELLDQIQVLEDKSNLNSYEKEKLKALKEEAIIRGILN